MTPERTPRGADEQAIRDLIQRWMQASSEGDLDTLLGMMTSDVVFLTVGSPPMSRDDFARRFGSIDMTKIALEGRVETEEVVIDGDLATMSNIVSVTMGQRGGPSRETRFGRTLTVLRRGADGTWRIWRDANLMAG